MARVRTTVEKEARPILNLNLRIFYMGGLLLALLISPFLRGLYFQSELLPVLILVGVAFIFCIYDQVLRRDPQFLNQPLDWAMALLIIAYLLSLLTAVHLRPAISEVLKVTAYFMVYWMAYRATLKKSGLHLILFSVYLAGLGVALIGIAAAAGLLEISGAYVSGRILSTLQYPNTLAIYLSAANIIGLALGVKSEKLIPRLFYALGNMLLIVVIVGTQSRGGWVLYPLAVALFIYLLNYSYRWRALYHLMIYLGCGLVAAQVFFNGLKNSPETVPTTGIVLGLAAVLILQTLYHYLGVYLNRDRVQEHTRKIVAIGGLLYLALVLMVYLWYASAAFPIAFTNLLPSSAIARSQHISADEVSWQARMEFSGDAMKIVKDHPLTGTGGGGWEALYHSYADRLYWSNQTHNYFAQTWAEAGTIGFLGLLAISVLFLRLIWQLRRIVKRRENREEILVWAAAAAALALLIHSALDFDLSLAAIGLLLYSLIGSVKGRKEALERESSRSPKTQNPPRFAPGLTLTAIAFLGSILAIAVVYPAYSFYLAGVAGASGADALQAKDIEKALPYYQEAVRRDPYTASYLVDLAQIKAAQALAANDSQDYDEQALNYAAQAARRAPYDSRVRSILFNLYSRLGEEELMLKEARALAKANPLEAANHEILAAALLDTAQHKLQAGEEEQAQRYLEEIIKIPPHLPAGVEGSVHPLYLKAGQAALLLGDSRLAREYLESIEGKEIIAQAQLWLAALYTLDGDQAAAAEILAPLDPEQLESFLMLMKTISQANS